MMTTHPQHQHPLQLTDPLSIYREYQGQWNCDNCGISYDKTHTPYHCSLCSYDICQSCFQPKTHPRHGHPLYLSKMTNIYPAYNGEWKCDACERTKGLPQDPTAYHCFLDEFDLCHECFKGRNFVIHIHPLVPADAKKVYDNSPGLWICDSCKRTGIEMGTQYSWHCGECEFDCCNRCLQEVRISNHVHPLKITDSRNAYPAFNGGWKCDICNQDSNPDSPGFNMDKPFHCYTCQFDACHNCVNQALVRDRQNRGVDGDHVGIDVVGPPPSAYPHHETSLIQNPFHQPPMEMMEEMTDDDNVSVENLDDSQKCIVCFAKPKNATIVHGNTGHVCCCLSCAYTLKKRGDNCPICRAPIDRVIKHFNS